MDFMTGAILSGLAYDMVCASINFTGDTIKTKFKGWLIDDDIASSIADELIKLELNEDHSPKLIEKKINSSNKFLPLLKKVKSNQVLNINQSHSGTGDNIGRDKIINE